MMSNDSLLLKWGTVKGWDFEDVDCEAFQLLKKYLENAPASCMADHPDETRKKLLCEIIDKMDGEIQEDWGGEMLSKEAAKDYVMNYGR